MIDCQTRSRGEDPIIATVEEKIAEWTHVPPENGEQMQVEPSADDVLTILGIQFA